VFVARSVGSGPPVIVASLVAPSDPTVLYTQGRLARESPWLHWPTQAASHYELAIATA